VNDVPPFRDDYKADGSQAAHGRFATRTAPNGKVVVRRNDGHLAVEEHGDRTTSAPSGQIAALAALPV